MSHPDYKDIGHPAVRTIEECAELIHALCKAQRFGWNNHHPQDESERTHLVRVLDEIKNVRTVCDELESFLRVRAGEDVK